MRLTMSYKRRKLKFDDDRILKSGLWMSPMFVKFLLNFPAVILETTIIVIYGFNSLLIFHPPLVRKLYQKVTSVILIMASSPPHPTHTLSLDRIWKILVTGSCTLFTTFQICLRLHKSEWNASAQA